MSQLEFRDNIFIHNSVPVLDGVENRVSDYVFIFSHADIQRSVLNCQAHPTLKALYLKNQEGEKNKTKLAIEANLLEIQIVKLSDTGFKITANNIFRKIEKR